MDTREEEKWKGLVEDNKNKKENGVWRNKSRVELK